MSEEEIIERIRDDVKENEGIYLLCDSLEEIIKGKKDYDIQLIVSSLLDLYNKEKEKNKELEEKIKEKIDKLNNNMAEQLYIIKEFGEHEKNRAKLTMYKEQRDILGELLEEE